MKTNENKTQIYTMRINSDLLEILRKSAQKNKRTIAKEIEFQLEKIYKLNN